MKKQKAFLVGIHRYSLRAGEPAEVIGVSFCTPEGNEERLCFQIRFRDATEDYVAVSATAHYKIINQVDVDEGRIPEVTE